MNGEFNQEHEDYLERESEKRALRKMEDPVFLSMPTDPQPDDSIGQILSMVALAIAFCALLYALMWIPD